MQATDTREEGRTGSWLTTAIVFGLPLIFIAALLLAIGGLLGGDPEVLAFTAPFLIGAPLIAWLVLRFGWWAKILSLLGGVATLFFIGPGITTLFERFDSFFDFAPTLIGGIGAIVAVIASIAALIRERSVRAAPSNDRSLYQTLGAVAAVLAVVSVISAIVTFSSRDTVSAEDREGAQIVKMDAFEFDVEELEGTAGETVRIVVENEDYVYHTFTIEDLDIDVEFGPTDDKLIEFTAEAGTYTYICDVEGHEDMEGELTIN